METLENGLPPMPNLEEKPQVVNVSRLVNLGELLHGMHESRVEKTREWLRLWKNRFQLFSPVIIQNVDVYYDPQTTILNGDCIMKISLREKFSYAWEDMDIDVSACASIRGVRYDAEERIIKIMTMPAIPLVYPIFQQALQKYLDYQVELPPLPEAHEEIKIVDWRGADATAYLQAWKERFEQLPYVDEVCDWEEVEDDPFLLKIYFWETNPPTYFDRLDLSALDSEETEKRVDINHEIGIVRIYHINVIAKVYETIVHAFQEYFGKELPTLPEDVAQAEFKGEPRLYEVLEYEAKQAFMRHFGSELPALPNLEEKPKSNKLLLSEVNACLQAWKQKFEQLDFIELATIWDESYPVDYVLHLTFDTGIRIPYYSGEFLEPQNEREQAEWDAVRRFKWIDISKIEQLEGIRFYRHLTNMPPEYVKICKMSVLPEAYRLIVETFTSYIEANHEFAEFTGKLPKA